MIAAWALALMSLDMPEAVPADAAAHAQSAAEAWNRCALVDAGAHAAQAYAALAQGDCFVTPDGARLAFMAGVAALTGQTEGYSGYYFWAAGRLNTAAGGLNRTERRVVAERAVEPGLRPRHDWHYANSPLLADPEPRRARGCAPILPDLDRDPPAQDAALVIGWTRLLGGQYSTFQTLYAYPDRAGRALAQRVSGTYDRFETLSQRSLHVFAFTPCYTAYDEARLPFDLCLDGAPAP